MRNASNSTMMGIGITPEGINQNYIMYDLVMEIPWNEGSIDIDDWIMKYAQRRYGFLDEYIRNAWSILIVCHILYSSHYNIPFISHILVLRTPYIITEV